MCVSRRAQLAYIAALLAGAAMFSAGAAGLAENRWPDERSAGVFHCHADFQLENFDRLWSEMGKLEIDLRQHLRVAPVKEPIHLFLFRDEKIYRDYIGLHFSDVPYRKALYIKAGGPGMVFAYLNDEFANDVRHEGTHALLHASLPVVPLWLDEGLAEYFEVPAAERAFGNPHLGKTRWAARFAQVPRLEDLESIHNLNEMGAAEYRHAWAWVHFMLHGPAEAHEELVAFLEAIGSHSPPGVLSTRLRKRMPDVNVRFVEHFRNWKE